MRMVVMASLWALVGCDDGSSSSVRDAGRLDGDLADGPPLPVDAGPDATPPGFPGGCACDAQEDCAACIARIGECCYADPTILGQAPRLVENCEARSACRVCCQECAASTCEALRARDQCPNGVRDPG